MLDEKEFLSPYGIRSLSRYHAEHPYVFRVGDQEYRVSYLPAESDSGMFGGNSNWRGPIWMPVNALIIRALLQYYTYYGNDFTIECPTGSGRQMNLYQVAEEIARRLASIFLRDDEGRRPVYGGTRKFQEDPHWRDLPPVLRVLPRRQRRRPRRQPPDRLDRASSPGPCTCSRPARPSRSSSSARPPRSRKWRRRGLGRAESQPPAASADMRTRLPQSHPGVATDLSRGRSREAADDDASMLGP